VPPNFGSRRKPNLVLSAPDSCRRGALNLSPSSYLLTFPSIGRLPVVPRPPMTMSFDFGRAVGWLEADISEGGRRIAT